MAKEKLSPEEQLIQDEAELKAQIEAEEKDKADKQAALDALALQEKAASDKVDQDEAEHGELNDRKEHKIIIIKKTPSGLKEGEEKIVSGSVANILIKKGIAKYIETIAEKPKTN